MQIIENSPGSIYLLGVNHALQWDPDLAIDLLGYMEQIVQEEQIHILGEEFFQGILKGDPYQTRGITNTNLYNFANSHNLKHIYCDPDYDDRKKLGIRSPSEIRAAVKISLKSEKEERKPDDEKRESFWLGKLKPYKNRDILFVCGMDHLDSFAEKLKKEEFNVKTLPKTFDLKGVRNSSRVPRK